MEENTKQALTEAQAELWEGLQEAGRILNGEIRRAVAHGLDVRAHLLEMQSTRTREPIPQVDMSASARRPEREQPEDFEHLPL